MSIDLNVLNTVLWGFFLLSLVFFVIYLIFLLLELTRTLKLSNKIIEVFYNEFSPLVNDLAQTLKSTNEAALNIANKVKALLYFTDKVGEAADKAAGQIVSNFVSSKSDSSSVSNGIKGFIKDLFGKSEKKKNTK
jgi:uncharacterized protein YoxC